MNIILATGQPLCVCLEGWRIWYNACQKLWVYMGSTATPG